MDGDKEEDGGTVWAKGTGVGDSLGADEWDPRKQGRVVEALRVQWSCFQRPVRALEPADHQ